MNNQQYILDFMFNEMWNILMIVPIDSDDILYVVCYLFLYEDKKNLN